MPLPPFELPRDSSGVPVAGYDPASKTVSILAWIPIQITDEVVMTDASGRATVSSKPILDRNRDESTGVGDVTVRRADNDAPLFVGDVFAEAGVVEVFLDSALTQSATLLQVKISYWTLGALKTDATGALALVLSGPLPSGTNTIGKVDLASALPTGDNIVGRVQIWHGGLSIRDIIGLADAFANRLRALSPLTEPRGVNADGSWTGVGGWPLSVINVPLGYRGGNEWERVRITTTVKAVRHNPSGAADATVWTPASGKRIRLLGLSVQNNDVASGSPLLTLKDGTTTLGAPFRLGAGSSLQLPFGANGFLSGGVDRSLVISTGGAGDVTVWAWGLEE